MSAGRLNFVYHSFSRKMLKYSWIDLAQLDSELTKYDLDSNGNRSDLKNTIAFR